MSPLYTAIPTFNMMKANPLMFSAMAFSALMAFYLDFNDALTAQNALDLFPIRKG
ncbi:hypothetical protein SAMN06265338_1052 [Rhodoblastus acidophilus]|uniref:Uncharacterized protein n=1 Tax=Rhodoblastus acidophilus TaxID=1074 RepID=A0A212RK40_RHOAC|nr:hypothetical protein [Rhodoblastus acidophilus]MCW2315944.1 putative signal transduction protein with EAL and GGDEF domain [Rhodoblastus acidophilus]SNB72775.1 hypothetical protein SAMN06265338_1052 [Rhodoblastus acidophilus]